LPFLVLFQVGFLYVGLMSAFQGRYKSAPAATEMSAPVAEPRRAA
jgi:hypothetical protein